MKDQLKESQMNPEFRLLKIYLKSFLIFLLLSCLFIGQSSANSGNKDRFRSCTPEGGVNSTETPKPEGLNYDPLNGGKDFSFDETNPYCWTIVAPLYTAVKLTVATMNATCGRGSRVPRLFPSPFQDARDILLGTSRCLATTSAACCSATTAAYVELGSFIGAMRIQYEIAKDAYENSSLCGGGVDDNWTKWSSKSLTKNIPDKKNNVEAEIKNWIAQCNQDSTSSDCTKLRNGLNEIEYRQWFYGGVEREDISENACPDVTRIPNPQGGENLITMPDSSSVYPAQRYYMRGTDPGNYACERFNYRLNPNDPLAGNSSLSAARIAEYDYAYKCCLNKSKTNVCIERKYLDGNLNRKTEHKFCQAGSDCSIGPGSNRINYSANFYNANNQMICVNTTNLCPYDFNLGGGSTECDNYRDGAGTGNNFVPINLNDISPVNTCRETDSNCIPPSPNCAGKSEIRNDDCSFNEKAGKCRNYCQYLSHCVMVGGSSQIYNSSISSPYFSSACLNFIGDSKNGYGYNTGIFAGVQKHFTAPIAQCVRETLENVFYNRAGYSLCENFNEYPDKNGNCFSNSYKFKKGQPIAEKSFFSYIQDNLKDAIRLVLTISIMMQGIRMLLTNTPLKHSELIMYIVKIGLVLFFATGNAWQGYFFDGVYKASETISTVVMNIKTSDMEMQRDGCQFGKISLPDGSSTTIAQYPQGKEYLAIFDTFDCKIARYLGFGPSATVANIAKIILPALISPWAGAIGVYFAVLTMAFGFFMIAAALRALHIFLTSAFAIILLVYVSPITITAILFQKTKPMFDRWLNNLIGYSLQPIILFAYMGFFITIFETLVVGSATFSGQAPTKEIVCDKVCVDVNGNRTVLLRDDGLGGLIDNINNSVINPSVNATINNVINPAAEALGANGNVSTIGNNNNNTPICDLDAGSKILDPMSDSVACMMNLKNEHFGQIPVLAPLGIALPVIKDFFTDNGRQKILAMMKAIFIIYILTKFMDEIPDIASTLMGGNTLSMYKIMTPAEMAEKTTGMIKGVQTRGAGGTRKIGKKIISAVRGSKKKDKDD